LTLEGAGPGKWYDTFMQVASLRRRIHPSVPYSFCGTRVGVCWNWRSSSPGMSPIVDLNLLHHPVRDISFLLDGFVDAGELAFLRQSVKAHLRAAITGELPVNTLIEEDVVPSRIVNRLGELWSAALVHVIERSSADDVSSFLRLVSPVIPAICSIEDAGIYIDKRCAADVSADPALELHERSAARSFLDLSRVDGFAHVRISPVGSKTRRLRVEGGMQCMSIPHGAARRCVTSRFEGGSIASIDFNAIDFRCLVADSGIDTYSGSVDFHARTCELLDFPIDRRDAVKAVTYVKLYGGSYETLLARSGLSRGDLDLVSIRFDEKLSDVIEYCREVAARGRRDGHVDVEGYSVPVPHDAHSGQVVGLYAQTRSSLVFNRALTSLTAYLEQRGLRSRVIFPVHDELVVDLASEDAVLIPEMLKASTTHDPEFQVKVRIGKNYDEATG